MDIPLFFTKKPSLNAKLLLLYFLTVFIPLVVVTQVVLSISGNKIIKYVADNTVESVTQIDNNLKVTLNQYVDICDRLYYDNTLKSILNPDIVYDDVLKSIDAYDSYLKTIPQNVLGIKSKNAMLKIYFTNTTLLQDYYTYKFIDNDVKTMELYKRAVKAGGRMSIYCKDESIYISRELINAYDEFVGVISIEFQESSITSLINKFNPDDKLIIICDDNGFVYSSNNSGLIGKSVEKEGYFHSKVINNSGVLTYKNGSEFKVIKYRLSDMDFIPGLQIITVIPLDKLLSDGRRMKELGMVISVICLVVSCLIFTIVLRKILARIKLLGRMMRGVENGSFESLKRSGANDEIDMIIDNYNIMVEGLKKLIYENYEVNMQMKDIAIKKREAELYALQSQMNPHFLFNVLESIRMKMHNKFDNEALVMLINLSKILRKSLNWKGDVIKLAEEMEFTRNYLELQMYRFRKKMLYEINIPEELLNCRVLKLSIQPIVENAIKHGIEKKSDGGFIRISAGVAGGTLTVTVVDDGPGMSSKTLDEIMEGLHSEASIIENAHIGIRNINDRIRLYYGNGYGIRLESAANIGTTVYIAIPFNVGEGKDEVTA